MQPTPAEPTPVTISDRDTTLPPAPVGPYAVGLGPLKSFAATFHFALQGLPEVASLSFVVAVFHLPLGVFPWLVGVETLDSGPMDTVLTTMLWITFGLAIFVVSAAAGGGMIHVTDERVRGGVHVGPVAAFMEGLRHAGWMLLGYLVLMLTVSLAMLSLVTPLIVTANHGESWGPLVILPAIAAGAVSAVLGTRLIPLLAVLVVEDLALHEALARSWILTRGRALRVFGGACMMSLLYLVANALSGAAGMALLSRPTDFDLMRIGVHVLNTGVLAVFLPLIFLFSFSVYAGCVAEDQASAV